MLACFSGAALMAAEFDRFAENYEQILGAAVAISGEGPAFFSEYKIAVLARMVARRGVRVTRILDFGAGIGNSVPYFRQHFPDAALTSADVSQASLDRSEARFPGQSLGLRIDGMCIPAETGAFDLVFSACVFHHIPHEQHVAWLRELERVTRPGGMLTLFEHNPLNPLTVRSVRNCPFDENARLIRSGGLSRYVRDAGWREPEVSFHLFFPHVLAGLRPLERHLSRVPFGAQYAVSALR